MVWLRTTLRRFRTDRAPAIGLALLVFATAFVFALAPLVLDAVGDRALRDEVAVAPPAERNLQLRQERRIKPDPRGPMAGVQLVGDDLETQLSDGIRRLIVDRSILAETTRWGIDDPTPTPSFAYLRFQPGIESRVKVADGRLPAGTTTTLPVTNPDGSTGTMTQLEVALSTETAKDLAVSVGQTLHLSLDPSDRLNERHSGAIAVTVVGIFDVIDRADPWFDGDEPLTTPAQREISPSVAYYDVRMLASPDAYDAYMTATDDDATAMTYSWRFYTDPLLLQSEDADQLLVDLRRAESVFPSSTAAQVNGGTALRSGLLRIITAQQASWHAAEAILTVAAVGPAFIALAALGLVAILATERRRPTLLVWRGRGASVLQVGAAALTEGILLAVPATILGVALAAALIPTGPARTAAIAAAVVAVTTTLLVVWTARPSTTTRATGVARPPSTRRLVLEILVVLLAIGGAILLRDRGIRGASATGSLGTADPFIAIAPALLGLAAALIALRLQPLALRGAARLAATRADLVPVLGLRRATRSVGVGGMLLVLLVTAAIGAFSVAIVSHLDRAADIAAWQEVGAAYHLDKPDGRLSSTFDPLALPGVTAGATAYEATSSVTDTGREATLIAVDPVAYAAVVAGTPVDLTLPPELSTPLAATDPLPVVISDDQVDARAGFGVGSTTRVAIQGRYTDVRVVGTLPTFPSMPVGAPFLIVSRPQAERARPLPTTDAFLRAPSDAADALRQALSAPGLVLADVDSSAIAIHDSPALDAVRAGVTIAALIAAAYAAIALAAGLALTASARARELALLRTIGVSEDQGLRLQLVEHGPTIVISFLLGIALGLGVFIVLRPGLGLEGIIGSRVDVPPSVDLTGLAIVAIVVLVVSGLAFAIAAVLSRAVTPASVTRRGVE